MENIKFQTSFQRYKEAIKKAAWWYYRLWPSQHYDVDDLIQAGNIAVYNISEKFPEKLENKLYVNAAIRYSIFGEMKKFSPKRKEIHLVRQYDENVTLVDLLGVHDKNPKRFEELDEILYYIKNIFPEGKKYSNNLIRLIESCDDIYDLNLSEPPETELKDKVKIITKMDLSDEELFMWASVLLGTKRKFPNFYFSEHPERVRKYIKNLIQLLDMSPEEFAMSYDKKKILREYKLEYWYEQTYNSILTMLKDVFNLEAYKIYGGEGKWEGEKGLLNAYNAIGALVKKTGKKPIELTREDFRENKLSALLKLFNNSYKKAVKFRFPGTYQQIAEVRLHLIKPFLEGEEGSLRTTAKSSSFSYGAIRKWVSAYREHGVEGLKLEPRNSNLNKYVNLVNEKETIIRARK